MIGLADHLGLLKRLADAPLEPLVDALRDLHNRGQSDPAQIRRLLASLGAQGSALRPAVSSAAPTMPADYEAARQHFVAHAQRLREQAILTERLLDGLMNRGHPHVNSPLTHELTLACGKAGSSTAPFIVVNRLDHPVRVVFRIGHAHSAAGNTPAITFDPDTCALAPGAETGVRVTVDVRGCLLTAAVTDVGVDVLGDERLLLKLWLRIETTFEEGRGATDGEHG